VKVRAGRPEETFYDEAFLKKRVGRYNRNVKDYVRVKDAFLIVNVVEDGAYQELCAFLGEEPLYNFMPWNNSSKMTE
jgi:hypothetical protein